MPWHLESAHDGIRPDGDRATQFAPAHALDNRHGRLRWPGGRFFTDGSHEAVLGNYVASKVGVKVGDTIAPYHGLQYSERQKHNDQFKVVGILKGTNSPSDRVVWIPIEGIYRMSGHVLRGTGRAYQAKADSVIPEDVREVSAVMLKLKDPQAGIYLDQTINPQGKSATLAWPIG